MAYGPSLLPEESGMSASHYTARSLDTGRALLDSPWGLSFLSVSNAADQIEHDGHIH
jgi:hypothetical protein